ncbi:MAG TPA: type II toxin-antitoxin system Phd/YefM family antitoxin [Myxococcota bacterium]|nr:type II toxin-antitoxin system Phd/YefM family antitoxin [Myxococcota bacterium]
MVAHEDEIGSFEAKTRLAELLRETEKGRSFVIRRRGKAVARLVPHTDDDDRPDFAELLEEFREIRKRVGPGLSIRELIEEGRRF